MKCVASLLDPWSLIPSDKNTGDAAVDFDHDETFERDREESHWLRIFCPTSVDVCMAQAIPLAQIFLLMR